MGNIYIGDSNSKARKIKSAYIGVDGIARKIKAIYVGDENGKARLVGNMGGSMLISLYKNSANNTICVYDGSSFNIATTNLASNTFFSNIAYNNDENKYVALIRNVSTGTSVNGYSYDGYTWTTSNGSPGEGKYLYYTDGVYISGVDRWGVYYSTNMTSWTKAGIYDGSYIQEATYDPQSGHLAEIYWDNYAQKRICAISKLGSNSPILRYDADTYSYTNIIVTNDYFIFGLKKTIYLISRTNPSPQGFYHSDYELNRLCYHDGMLLGCDNYYVYKSTDFGKTLTQVYQFSPYLTCVDLCFYNGHYWLAGTRSEYDSSGNYSSCFYLYKSTNGSDWTLAYKQIGCLGSSNCLCVPVKNGGRY